MSLPTIASGFDVAAILERGDWVKIERWSRAEKAKQQITASIER